MWAGPAHRWILVESWPNLARIPAWVCMAVEFVSAPAVNKDPCTNPPMTDVCYRHIKVLQWKRMRADKNQANLSPYLSALDFLTLSSSKYRVWNSENIVYFKFEFLRLQRQKNRVQTRKWYFITKIVLTYCGKKILVTEKNLKFEAKGREFTKIVRSQEQFI